MLTKNYLESEYKQAIREFKAAIDENAQWEARKTMARLEMIAGQMYGFDYLVQYTRSEILLKRYYLGSPFLEIIVYLPLFLKLKNPGEYFTIL